MLDPSGEPLKVQPGMEGVAQTQADMAVGPMLLELYNLGAIEEAELRSLERTQSAFPNFIRPSPRDSSAVTASLQDSCPRAR